MAAPSVYSNFVNLVAEAEALFGPRELANLGVVFTNVSNPMALWSQQANGAIFAYAALGESLLNDEEVLNYQLAHESVHCLAHSPIRCTALEEGCATYFGLNNTLISPARSALEEARLDAVRSKCLADVRALLQVSPQGVWSLRNKTPKFQDITEAELQALGAPPALAKALATPV